MLALNVEVVDGVQVPAGTISRTLQWAPAQCSPAALLLKFTELAAESRWLRQRGHWFGNVTA